MTTFAASKHVCHEENISAIKQEKKEQARFQGADVISQRKGHNWLQKEEGPEKIDSLRRSQAQSITKSFPYLKITDRYPVGYFFCPDINREFVIWHEFELRSNG